VVAVVEVERHPGGGVLTVDKVARLARVLAAQVLKDYPAGTASACSGCGNWCYYPDVSGHEGHCIVPMAEALLAALDREEGYAGAAGRG
jgi:hypothetical protein